MIFHKKHGISILLCSVLFHGCRGDDSSDSSESAPSQSTNENDAQSTKENPATCGSSFKSFEESIMPVLNARCSSCHGDVSPAGGLTLKRQLKSEDPTHTQSDIMKMVMTKIRESSMPPPPLAPLRDCERQLFEAWANPVNQSLNTPPAEESCQNIPPKPLGRLSKAEYRRSLAALTDETTMKAVDADIAVLPEDDSRGGFANQNFYLSILHIKSYANIAAAIGNEIKNNPERLLGKMNCPAESFATCARAWLDIYMKQAWRRPIAPSELDRLAGVLFDMDGKKLLNPKDFFYEIFQSPYFIYKLETEGSRERDSEVLHLTSYEIAARLSFLALGTVPSAKLIQLAEEGKLQGESNRRAVMASLFTEDSADPVIKQFFSEWLHLRDNVPLNYSPRFLDGIETKNLVQDANKEVLDFIRYVIWRKQGFYKDLLTLNTVLTSSPALKKIYELEEDTPAGKPMSLPADRKGLFTRVGLLMQGQNETQPIRRGSYLRQQILCDVLHQPDPTQLPPGSLSLPKPNPNASTRQRWEEKTQGTVCQGCHSKLNPLGFVMEGYDALGRERTEELIFGKDDSIVARQAIDTAVRPNIAAGDPATAASAAEFMDLLADHPKAKSCFVRNWFRFSQGRSEKITDRCLLQQLETRDDQRERSVADMMIETVSLPNFTVRRLEP